MRWSSVSTTRGARLRDWWTNFAGSWSWDDPVLVLGVLTIVVTAMIPIFIWRLGVKQAARDSRTRNLQTATLDRLERIQMSQRRDSLLSILDTSSDGTHLSLLWDEVRGFSGKERQLLQAAFRANTSVALPGAYMGYKVIDKMDDFAAADYVAGLERRYTRGSTGNEPYNGLVRFLDYVSALGREIDSSAIVALVTGPSSEVQRPGHGFFRELVNVLPKSASGLLLKVEDIDYRKHGGTRLNLLTGTLLGIKDVELGRSLNGRMSQDVARAELRVRLPVALAQMLHRDNLRSFDQWSLEGSTEPVSATVAWLIRAVGWLADTDDHLAMLMIQNLSPAIESIPTKDRRWGIDAVDIRQGFEWIREKQPDLWEAYGPLLETAATEVGPWLSIDGEV